MKKFLAPILLMALLGTNGARAQNRDAGPDHKAWDRLLYEHVRPDGTVDYPGFAGDRPQLDDYLSEMASRVPDPAAPRNRRLAYFINLYNALTVRLILDNYPLESIRDLPNPWGGELISLEGKGYSLDDIEHKVLRKMGEPRIHFALNCASASCPVLQPFAFSEEKLDAQLNWAARAFINDPERNRFQPGLARLSSLFNWYRGDFEKASGSLAAFLNTYLDTPLEPGCRIRFLPYDWGLNQSR